MHAAREDLSWLTPELLEIIIRAEAEAARERHFFGDELRYFVSGSNHPGEIDAVVQAGRNVGVAVDELNEEGLRALEALRHTGTDVFVDSGAFGEVRFSEKLGAFETVAPIGDEQWRERLAVYRRLAAALGPHVFVVAPDKVADQATTLARLERFAPEIRELHALRAVVIVPVHKGALSLAEAWRRSVEILGFADFSVGIPSRKNATTVPELRAFLEEVGPERMHLLGIGPRSVGDAFAARKALIAEVAPWCEWTCDSVRVIAHLGKSNGPGGGPRAYTKNKAALKATGFEGSSRELNRRAFGPCMNAESNEVVDQARARGWYDAELEDGPTVPLVAPAPPKAAVPDELAARRSAAARKAWATRRKAA